MRRTNAWPIRLDPTVLPSTTIIGAVGLAWEYDLGDDITTAGKTRPVITVNATGSTPRAELGFYEASASLTLRQVKGVTSRSIALMPGTGRRMRPRRR